MTSISARVRAIEESLQRDQSDDESFDYNDFMLNRNKEVSKDQPSAIEIRAQFDHIAKQPEEPEVVASSRNLVIDSDSEDENDAAEADQDEQDESGLISENDSPSVRGSPSSQTTTRKFLKPAKSRNTSDDSSHLDSKPRKSRVNAEQELARMRRQLDLDIEIYTKPAPSVSDFINKFKETSRPPRSHEESDDLEIIDEVPRPIISQSADPRMKLFTDLYKMSRQQIKEQDEFKKRRWAEKNGLLDDEEDEVVSEREESKSEPVNIPDKSPDKEGPMDEVSENFPEGSSEECDDAPSMPSSQTTEINETQVEAPIDPHVLRRMYRKQQKIFNDSDSEEESSQSDPESSSLQHTDNAINREELEKLSSSQQYAELRRRHEQKREMMLQMLEQQAQESDEEGGVIAASDDDEDDGPPVENLIDDTKQDIQENELHSKFVDAEREMDEYVTNMIRRDVVNGGWRTKHLYNETGMLQDDADDLDEETIKRRERIRKSVLENSSTGKLFKDPKTRMFAEAIVESYMPEKQNQEEVYDTVNDCLTSMFGAKEVAPSSPIEQVEMLPTPPQVVSSLPRSNSMASNTRNQRISVLTRALPSAHAVPRLASTHAVKRRAKLAEPAPKTPKLRVKPVGLGY